MRFYLKTTGCRANQWDSYVINNLLIDNGCAPSQLEEADLCIINACTLTEGAERDIKRFINLCRAKNPGCRIIIAGCHGEVYPEKTCGADTVIGHLEKFHIKNYLDSKEHTFKSIEKGLEKATIKGLQPGKTRFFLKIQDGCDRFCSYCIVPFARGTPKSRELNEVIEANEKLYELNIKEVVLTGIELSAYRDEKTGTDLKGLLEILEDTKTPPRIRLSSIDPLYIDDKFINIMAKSKKIAKSIHISAQSFSDKILKLMGRNYTKGYLIDTIKKLNREIDGIGIGLDVIVGFPQEDEDAFNETYNSINSLDVYYLHVFPFSPREKTLAACMEDKVPYVTKKQRVNAMRLLDKNKRQSFFEKFIGKKAMIIPEDKKYRGYFIKGYTDNYIPVFLPYKKNLENKLIEVKIMGIENGFIIAGEIP